MSRNDNSVVPALRQVLAETFALYFNTHASHWNVVGMNFASLHLLLETQYNEIHDSVDEIAERIRAVDAKAPASLADATAPSKIKDGIGSTEGDMLKQLIAGHEHLCKTLNDGVKIAQDNEDEGSADLFIQRLRAHQKHAWMLKAHLAA